MSKRFDLNKILILEAVIWFLILCVVLFSIRAYNYKRLKQKNQYQIFVSDIDGLIVGSPVKYMGVQIGYVSYIKLISNEVYVKFIINNSDIKLPAGTTANVEFGGMAGTKSLELYPPNEESLKTQKLINVRDTFRLSKTFAMIDNMVSKLARIGGRFSYFMKQITPYLENKGVANERK